MFFKTLRKNKKSQSTSAVPNSDLHAAMNRTKILLLGTGDSGKSTVQLQGRYIFHGGFREEDRIPIKYILMENVLSAIVQLINGAKKLGLETQDSSLKAMMVRLLEANKGIEGGGSTLHIVLRVKEDIKVVWAHPFIKSIFEQRSKFFCFDQAQYYLDNIDRMLIPAFMPTDEDIVKCYCKTLGATEYKFQFDSQLFSLVDTGGQRNERKKWFLMTQDTQIVIYVCALNEFDKNLYEESTVNRMVDSLEVFAETINSSAFKNIQIILLLNKLDLFREKIKTCDLKDFCFPEYKDGLDPDKALQYIKNRFMQCNTTGKKIPIFEGSALDPLFMKPLFYTILKKTATAIE